jgi:flagellar basal-body rod protein FlgB
MGAATSGGTEVSVVDIGRSAPSIDGNGVDLDRTMAVLAENGLQYAAGAKAAGKKLAILRYVVSDGAA